MNDLGGQDKVPRYEFNPDKAMRLIAEVRIPRGGSKNNFEASGGMLTQKEGDISRDRK